MNKSAQMREMAKQGLSTAEIAREMGVRYQFVRNVLVSAGIHASTATGPRRSAVWSKPTLTSNHLLSCGFRHVSSWSVDGDSLVLRTPVDRCPGVYAFCCDGRAMYVGLASIGLAQRLYFYGRPGVSQKTSIRIRAVLLSTLGEGRPVEVLIACPPDFDWNGLRVSGAEGLEAALIKDFATPWNKRGT